MKNIRIYSGRESSTHKLLALTDIWIAKNDVLGFMLLIVLLFVAVWAGAAALISLPVNFDPAVLAR